MGKAMFLTGAAVGYVLGARAGRERYEQIRRATDALRSNPKIQQATEMATARGNEMAHKVADSASEKAHSLAGAATEKASSMAGTMADKAPGWMPGSRDSDSDSDTLAAATARRWATPACR